MIATFGIKAAAAMGTLVSTILVFLDRHFMFAYTAENSFGIKFIFVPYFGFMSCCFFMTKKAGIVSGATFKLNGNYIKWRMIVRATCLFINGFSFHYNHCVRFNLPLIAQAASPLFFLHQCICPDAQPMFVQQYSVLL